MKHLTGKASLVFHLAVYLPDVEERNREIQELRGKVAKLFFGSPCVRNLR